MQVKIGLFIYQKQYSVNRLESFSHVEYYRLNLWNLQGEYKKHSASTHNGRLEGLDTSKLYGKPFSQGKRCAVVINGFYEWKTDKQTGKKQPYYMYKKSADDLPIEKQVLNLAGLFDKWTSEEVSMDLVFFIVWKNSLEHGFVQHQPASW